MSSTLSPDKAQNIEVNLEFTPNPNTLKYVTSVALHLGGVYNFPKPEDAVGKAPLAEALFKEKEIAGVLIAKNFVTVTLSSQNRLSEVNESIIHTIKNFLKEARPAIHPEVLESPSQSSPTPQTEIEKKIIDILERDVRPAVARDGGDITFERFENGIVYLHMKGSCAGCPSSTATLKMGIEMRLREAIPEVLEIVPV